jgi:hypothetical protein
MAQVLFIVLTVIAAAYFLWRMKVDPLAVAFGASVVYFTPGFFGVAQFSYGAGLETYSEPIVPGAYFAMGLVLVALTAVALAADCIPVGSDLRMRFDTKVPVILLVFAIVSGAISIQHTGVYYLCLDKTITLSKLDPWYYYAAFSVPFAFAAGYCLRQWLLVGVATVGLLADLYAGFRLTAAITFLAVAMLAGQRLPRGWRKVATFATVIFVGGASLFVVKHLIVPVKYATGSYCDAQLALDAKSISQEKSMGAARPAERAREAISSPLSINDNLSTAVTNLGQSRFYVSAFVSQSEAFVIQSILNEVVRKDFHTDAGYLVGQILTGLPLGASVFGIDSSKVVTFNAMMQPALFPRVGFGMANNPWAQAYAAGGEWMVAVFALGYALVMGILSVLFRKVAGSLKAAFAVIGAWVGFYFHRNDLFVEAIFIKHVVYVCGASFLVAWAWDWIVTVARPAQRD